MEVPSIPAKRVIPMRAISEATTGLRRHHRQIFSGALIGVILLYRQKEKDLQMQVPFGIFLGIGSLISLLFGEAIINWYLRSFVG